MRLGFCMRNSRWCLSFFLPPCLTFFFLQSLSVHTLCICQEREVARGSETRKKKGENGQARARLHLLGTCLPLALFPSL